MKEIVTNLRMQKGYHFQNNQFSENEHQKYQYNT